MFGIINFGAFLFAGLLLNLTPGPDTMYILGKSISQGKKAGILSALGITTGSIIHTIFATIGLSVILTQSATAFAIVKYAGACYLIYLGINALTTKSQQYDGSATKVDRINYKKIYLSGILTNVLNPKVALFFLAFLPQFINPDYVDSALPFLILGLSFVTTGTIWSLILAFFSADLFSRIVRNPKVKVWLDKTTGALFILLGIKLALTRK